MAQQPLPHSDVKKVGLTAALIVALLLAAGLSVVVFTRRHAPATKPTIADAPRAEIPPDVADTGTRTERALVEFADKKDPGRAAGRIEWAKLEPINQIKKRLTEPRGYIFMRDGGLVRVASRSGELNTTPKSQEPQSGRFDGGVTLELFPAGFDPKADQPTLIARTESLEFDLPSASTWTSAPFTINSTAIDIDGNGMRLVANQVEEGIERFEVAHVNKVVIRPDAKDPLQSHGLTETQTARATPGSTGGPVHKRTYRAVIDGAVNIVQAGRSMTADRAEAWAHLVNNRLAPGAIGRFGPDPALTGSCPDTGDPNNSILSLPSELPPAPRTPALHEAAASPLAPGASPVDSTITAKWTGGMVVTPVQETGEGAQPPELAGNLASLRLLAGRGGDPVKVTDESMKGEFTAARVDVGGTTREFTLTSTPSMPVHVQTQSAGSLDCPSAVVKLGEGRIDLAGPGVLNPAAAALAKGPLPAAPALPSPAPLPGAKPGVPPVTTLSFAKSLALKFLTIGNWITPDASSATIKGGFTAASGDVKASADEATVTFNPRVADHTPIKDLRLSGHAVASAPAATRAVAGAPAAPAPAAPKPADADAVRDTLQGDQMTFVFKPDPATGHDLPTSVEVTGDAQATAGGAGEQGLTLKARTITAELASQNKQLVVAHAKAADEVHVSTNPKPSEPPMIASGDLLNVDPAKGEAVLEGVGNGSVTVSGNGATMIGKRVVLTQADSNVFVDGAGTLVSMKEEDSKNPDPAKLTTSTVMWKKSMTFNNATGKATCLGDAAAIMTVGETERNTAHAETIVLTFSPAPPSPSAPSGGEGAGRGSASPRGASGTPAAKAQSPTRELLTAEALGELGADRQPPRPATLERREFTVVNGEPHLDKLMYLEGQRIVADQPKRTLDVPVPGKLLVDDRTPEPVRPDAPAAPSKPADPTAPLGGFASAKGTSLFSWNGSLHLDMAGGKAVLSKDVQLTHQPLAAAGQPAPAQTTVDCDLLTAFLKTAPAPAVGAPPPPAAPALTGLNASLEKVEASGNVIAKSDGSQLTAETISFDTLRQFMEAAGGNGPNAADLTLVTYIDPKRPAPLRARKLTWDQKTSEVRIIDPAPTTLGQ